MALLTAYILKLGKLTLFIKMEEIEKPFTSLLAPPSLLTTVPSINVLEPSITLTEESAHSEAASPCIPFKPSEDPD